MIGRIIFRLAIAVGVPTLLAEPNPREEPAVIDDFETAPPGWAAGGGAGKKAVIEIGQSELPPVQNSKSYLIVRFYGTAQMGLRITPIKERRISGYVRRIEFWVSGTGNSDDVYLDLVDQAGKRHRLFAGRLNFSGWRLLSVTPGPEVAQRGKTITADSGLVFSGFYVRPHFQNTPGLCTIHIDSVRAFVRPFLLRPGPAWP